MQRIIDNGMGYESNGSVYFDTQNFRCAACLQLQQTVALALSSLLCCACVSSSAANMSRQLQPPNAGRSQHARRESGHVYGKNNPAAVGCAALASESEANFESSDKRCAQVGLRATGEEGTQCQQEGTRCQQLPEPSCAVLFSAVAAA